LQVGATGIEQSDACISPVEGFASMTLSSRIIVGFYGLDPKCPPKAHSCVENPNASKVGVFGR
jgi:hypothetical protein